MSYPINRNLKHPTLNAFKADKIPVNTNYFDNTGNQIDLKADATLPRMDGSNLYNIPGLSIRPYSVNSAKIDSNGNADFIQKDTDSQITILAGGSNPNLISTDCNGTSETLSTNKAVAINTYNGIHTIIKENGTDPVAIQTTAYFTSNTTNANNVLTNIIGLDWSLVRRGQPISGTNIPSGTTISDFISGTSITMSENATASSTSSAKTIEFNNIQEANVLPTTNLLDGMYVVITNPLKCYKRVSSAWEESTMKKLGEITKTNGIINATTISYALNGKYNIEQNTLTNSTMYTFNHNIGSKNLKVSQYVECKIADIGFVPGDKLYTSQTYNYAGNTYNVMITILINQVFMTIGNNVLLTINKTNGASAAATISRWKAGVRLERVY